MSDIAAEAFRKLRREWFQREVAFQSAEREWETAELEAKREEANREIQAIYDAQTEGILQGEDYPIAPTYWEEMERKNP